MIKNPQNHPIYKYLPIILVMIHVLKKYNFRAFLFFLPKDICHTPLENFKFGKSKTNIGIPVICDEKNLLVFRKRRNFDFLWGHGV